MSELKLSPRDVEIISKVFQCLVTPDALKIDTEKLAELANFANAKSANASWLSLKKKLLNGVVLESATKSTTAKKNKGKGVANDDVNEGDEATSSVATPMNLVKAVKSEPADTEGGVADTEKTPTTATPKKGRPKKAIVVFTTDPTEEASNTTAATEAVTPTPKRKRGPNKPKDPNATPTKRAKKGAKAGITTTEGNYTNAANAQLDAGGVVAQNVEGNSMSGGEANVTTEAVNEEGASSPVHAEKEDMAMPDTHAEDQAA